MRKPKTLIFAFFVICMLLAGTASVSAECTGVYVGPEASSDGSVILARCNDTQGTNPSRVNVMPRVENQPGRTMPVDMAGKVQAKLPKTTYKYTEIPFMDRSRTCGRIGKRSCYLSEQDGTAGGKSAAVPCR